MGNVRKNIRANRNQKKIKTCTRWTAFFTFNQNFNDAKVITLD